MVESERYTGGGAMEESSPSPRSGYSLHYFNLILNPHVSCTRARLKQAVMQSNPTVKYLLLLICHKIGIKEVKNSILIWAAERDNMRSIRIQKQQKFDGTDDTLHKNLVFSKW